MSDSDSIIPPYGPNASGLCQCGCGDPAPIATQTFSSRGVKKGEHLHYIRGHAVRGRHTHCEPPPPPNPSGLCRCGCGQKTPIARATHRDLGYLKGHPIRFVLGHNNKGKGRAPDSPEAIAAAERQKAYNRAWHAANRDSENAKAKARYAAHREEVRQSNAAWRESHPEYHPAWKRTNLEKIVAYGNTRRARKEGNGGTHTGDDIEAQYERQKGKCFYCGVKLKGKYHVDHVVPIFLGGSNGPENLVVACPPCNHQKHAKHPMDFAGILF